MLEREMAKQFSLYTTLSLFKQRLVVESDKDRVWNENSRTLECIL